MSYLELVRKLTQIQRFQFGRGGRKLSLADGNTRPLCDKFTSAQFKGLSPDKLGTTRKAKMNPTTHYEYRGWDIAIHCTRRAVATDEDPRNATFTASAPLTLREGMCASEWVDSRIQVISLGNRFFATGLQCTETLLTEIKELIDALRR